MAYITDSTSYDTLLTKSQNHNILITRSPHDGRIIIPKASTLKACAKKFSLMWDKLPSISADKLVREISCSEHTANSFILLSFDVTSRPTSELYVQPLRDHSYPVGVVPVISILGKDVERSLSTPTIGQEMNLCWLNDPKTCIVLAPREIDGKYPRYSQSLFDDLLTSVHDSFSNCNSNVIRSSDVVAHCSQLDALNLVFNLSEDARRYSNSGLSRVFKLESPVNCASSDTDILEMNLRYGRKKRGGAVSNTNGIGGFTFFTWNDFVKSYPLFACTSTKSPQFCAAPIAEDIESYIVKKYDDMIFISNGLAKGCETSFKKLEKVLLRRLDGKFFPVIKFLKYWIGQVLTHDGIGDFAPPVSVSKILDAMSFSLRDLPSFDRIRHTFKFTGTNMLVTSMDEAISIIDSELHLSYSVHPLPHEVCSYLSKIVNISIDSYNSEVLHMETNATLISKSFLPSYGIFICSDVDFLTQDSLELIVDCLKINDVLNLSSSILESWSQFLKFSTLDEGQCDNDLLSKWSPLNFLSVQVPDTKDFPCTVTQDLELMTRVFDFIDSSIQAGRRLAINCRSGHYQSVGVLMLWLLVRRRFSVGDIFKFAIALERNAIIMPKIMVWMNQYANENGLETYSATHYARSPRKNIDSVPLQQIFDTQRAIDAAKNSLQTSTAL